MPAKNELLRQIPKVDDLINDARITGAVQGVCRRIIIDSIREQLDETREKFLRMEGNETAELSVEQLIDAIVSRALSKDEMSLRRVINATGVILHTNLGRAPLPGGVRDRIWEIAENYSTLEYDIESGARGSRYDHIRGLITKVTGAEDAFAVNNNAAAVLLALSTVASGKNVIVSRGELVEIGESFRIPEIMGQSGAKLVEVGSTNKTRLADYRKAIREGETGALLKVHTSNYKIVGFTEEVGLEELAELGHEYGIPVIHDLGSGALADLGKYGITGEPTVIESVSAGADIICFSGDKLLGGPQAGVIAGRASLIGQMKRNPLTRALRIDKLNLAALEATLRLYLDPESVVRNIPALSMLTAPLEVISRRTEHLFGLLSEKLHGCGLYIEDGYSQVGGGALPLQNLPTRIIKIRPAELTVRELEERLRGNRPPIVARIQKDHVCLDVRTVRDEDFPLIIRAFSEILN